MQYDYYLVIDLEATCCDRQSFPQGEMEIIEVGAVMTDARYPFEDHLNLKRRFTERMGLRKPEGMRGALRRVGLPLEGTHHRGIDDARNLAGLLPYIVDSTLPSSKEVKP